MAIFGIQSTSKFNDLQLNSLRKRTGNYFGGTGNSGAGTGNFTNHIQIHHRMRFSVHTAVRDGMMAEGEELQTNLLQASQRGPASSSVLDEVFGTHSQPDEVSDRDTPWRIFHAPTTFRLNQSCARTTCRTVFTQPRSIATVVPPCSKRPQQIVPSRRRGVADHARQGPLLNFRATHPAATTEK